MPSNPVHSAPNSSAPPNTSHLQYTAMGETAPLYSRLSDDHTQSTLGLRFRRRACRVRAFAWDLTCLYTFPSSLQQHMGFIYMLFVSRLRPMIKGLNVLGYQSHVLQRCHPTCGHEASSHLTTSATEAKIKDLILSKTNLSTPH